MQIKTKKHFSEVIKSMVEQLIDEYELDEITTSAAVPGYSTPFAFSSKKDRKKKLKRLTGYVPVNEALDKKDVEAIKKVIRDVVGDVFRDIWLKRNSWK